MYVCILCPVIMYIMVSNYIHYYVRIYTYICVCVFILHNHVSLL